MSQTPVKMGFFNFTNVELIKFMALTYDLSNSVYTNTGILVPAQTQSNYTGSAAAQPIAGIPYDSIIPSGYSDFVNGVVQYTQQGTAWPSAAVGAGSGRRLGLTIFGVSYGLFSGTGSIAPGDRIVVDYTLGTYYGGLLVSAEADGVGTGSSVTGHIVAGNVVALVGFALDVVASSSAVGTMFRVFVQPQIIKF